MAKRYQVWDKVSQVITPIGEVLTPEQWISRYPMANVEGFKLVIAGGQINGAFCGVLSEMVDMYERQGCDFSECKNDEEILDTIEAFENVRANAASTTVSDQTRIANALEDMVVLQEVAAME